MQDSTASATDTATDICNYNNYLILNYIGTVGVLMP